MSRYFLLDEDKAATARHGGELDGMHKWRLPGVDCHACGATWSSVGHDHPEVDLSGITEHAEFERPRPEPFTEFVRLRELARPFVPPGTPLPPGTTFGPLVGRASGRFGPIDWLGGIRLLMQPDALERLQAEGIRGPRGCRTELRFRQKNPPELLEIQLNPLGRLHLDCMPPDHPPPCATCGRLNLRWPEAPILDAASLPTELDLFRLGNFATMLIGTERLVDTVSRLQLDGITFRELPIR
ncbi:double-CXXCG motif protein [Myxococcus faecalis]|uniref:SitI6 family double-CXXCG motif immunity protein n=1 Tax=Myxococcus faecalis TaxID=3115646 RepID=UPI0038D119C5